MSPFVRYRLVDFGPISLFGQGSIGIGFSNTKIKTGNETNRGDKISIFAIGIRPGVAYKLSDKISLEAFLGGLYYDFESIKSPNGDKEKTHTFGLNATSALNLGFTYEF
ncbi:MAG TPA: hypothetical protein PK990_08340 [Salinivirgaceae bacterium]|nr:hypothetical protein [Salinivirgaceae bacterium]